MHLSGCAIPLVCYWRFHQVRQRRVRGKKVAVSGDWMEVRQGTLELFGRPLNWADSYPYQGIRRNLGFHSLEEPNVVFVQDDWIQDEKNFHFVFLFLFCFSRGTQALFPFLSFSPCNFPVSRGSPIPILFAVACPSFHCRTFWLLFLKGY